MEGKIKTNWTVEKLLKQNAELKAKLDNVKYFNRQEVEKIIIMSNTIEETITTICNLAIKSIDKDRIIEILKKRFKTWSMPRRFNVDNYAEYMEQIANEILSQ